MWELLAKRAGNTKPSGAMYQSPLWKMKRNDTTAYGAHAITKPRLMQKNICGRKTLLSTPENTLQLLRKERKTKWRVFNRP